MDLASLMQSLGAGGRGQKQNPDAPKPDTSESVYISSLALLKMLKHSSLISSHFIHI